MKSLELKIPPLVVFATLAALMWAVSLSASPIQVPAVVRLLAAAAFALAGGGFTVAGVVSMRRAKTTVNPARPETASSLVSSGIYGVTRNPMYLGLLLVLVGWAVFLSSAWALGGALAFFLYIGRFQITPEERALAARFGAEYAIYQSRVRRWL